MPPKFDSVRYLDHIRSESGHGYNVIAVDKPNCNLSVRATKLERAALPGQSGVGPRGPTPSRDPLTMNREL